MQYISLTTQDREEMLKAVGVSHLTDLWKNIPGDLRMKPLKLPQGISEMELLNQLRRQGQKNIHMDRCITFLGAGNYDHYIPPLVGNLATRGEFITAYTPYQAEASQGTLQAIYEFQSLICRLTGMDVANASMYDGASSLAEAVLLGLRATSRKKIFISDGVHPESVQTMNTYLSNLEVECARIPDRDGRVDIKAFKKQMGSDAALVIFQTPNFLGYLEDAAQITQIAHEAGSLALVSVNPLSLSVVASPGEYRADIAMGEGQPLGNPVSYGGPHFGFFATSKNLMRRIPGRLCGITEDLDGRRSYVLTLQAREQHIRREKATSNICTNHALCALKATIFLTALGEAGFKRLGELNVERSHEALEILTRLPQVKTFSKAPFFNEFTLKIDVDPKKLKSSLKKNKIIGPLHLSRFRKDWERLYLVAVTEQRSLDDVQRLAQAITQAS